MGAANSYLRPRTLQDALEALAGDRLTVAAGCTDLFAATQAKTLGGAVMDVTAIAGLRGIDSEDGGLRIGAATTWTDVARADLPPAFDGLRRAARQVGALQIQNRGTLGGNLCNASPAADGAPPLLTLDAEVELRAAGSERRMPLRDFLIGPRQTARRSDELVTAVLIPPAALAGDSAFLKLGARAHLVISIAMVAARFVVEDGVVASAALSVGACGPVATRLPGVEAALIGRPLDPSLIDEALVAEALAPIEDMRADANYRTSGAAELLRRAIAEIDQGRLAA